MKPSVALETKREAVREALRRYATIANPRVFGSVLHGDDKEGSDLDLLVDALPGTSLFTRRGLQEQLEELLGVRVQVVTPPELSRYFRDEALAEAVPL